MTFAELSPPIVPPWPLRSGLEAAARALFEPDGRSRVDFSRPIDEPALVAPDSVSWRVFKNPLALFIGGVTAVIMELAEPRVRTGVWQHTTFRTDPVRRLRSTGLAAMVTIYGARSVAEAMIARVRRIHDSVAGTTPSGETYRANDPELLSWVQGTAAYGFLQAYHAYVRPLSPAARNRYYAEGAAAARLYGATGAPTSEIELEMLFQQTAERLQCSPIVFEFDHAVGTRSAAGAETRAAPAGAGRRGSDAALGANDRGARRARPRALGRRAGAAGRRVGGPCRSGIEPGGPGLSADAPSRRLSLSRVQLTICATAAAIAFGVR
jgi:uncharacterized protein (DUF2236 family)